MAKFQTKQATVEATQWLKHYDHLQVERFVDPLRPGDTVCAACSKQMKEHGLLLDPAYTRDMEVVCPGDWIVQPALTDGRRFVVAAGKFSTDYEAVEP